MPDIDTFVNLSALDLCIPCCHNLYKPNPYWSIPEPSRKSRDSHQTLNNALASRGHWTAFRIIQVYGARAIDNQQSELRR